MVSGRDSRWVNYLRVFMLAAAPQASATSISLRSDYDYGSIISKAAQGNTGFGKSLCRATQMSPSLLLRRNRNISAAAATVRHGDLLHVDSTNYC